MCAVKTLSHAHILTAAFVDDLSVLLHSQNETLLPARDFFNEEVTKSSAPSAGKAFCLQVGIVSM